MGLEVEGGQNGWVLDLRCPRWHADEVTRIGVFGGTFDPPHNGHIAVVEAVLKSKAVDNIVVPVAAEPWQKTGLGAITPFDIRFEMTVAAFEGMKNVVVSDLERALAGPSYTIDLLNSLASDEVVLKPIIGADAASALATWHRVDDLVAGWEFIVINRPGHQITVPTDLMYQSVEMEPVDISSTDIRIAVVNGKQIDDAVSPAVDSLIQSHSLYT